VLRIVCECGSRPDREKGEKYRPLALMRDAALSQNKAALRPNQGGDRHKPSLEMLLLFLEFSGSFFGKTFLLANDRIARRVDDLVEIVRQPILVVRQRFKARYRALKLADFARNNGTFQRLGGFCRLRTKLLCRRHWMFCLRFNRTRRKA